MYLYTWEIFVAIIVINTLTEVCEYLWVGLKILVDTRVSYGYIDHGGWSVRVFSKFFIGLSDLLLHISTDRILCQL